MPITTMVYMYRTDDHPFKHMVIEITLHPDATMTYKTIDLFKTAAEAHSYMTGIQDAN